MKAVSLLSGGLDSQLAACLIKQQGIEVIGVNFVTPFFGGVEVTEKAAKNIGIDYHLINLGEEYREILLHPVYGYGKNFNPCIDCHGFMLKKAGEYMNKIGASFLITGEVVGERPMSQNKSSMNAVLKLSGLQGLIVRPLSARLLPITIPEEKKWIDREKLLDISGRNRSRQMALAEQFGLMDYPTPAGGCLLTEPNFAHRLKIYLDKNPDAPLDSLRVLRYGRQFYIDDHILLIVGRNQMDNERLIELSHPSDLLLKVLDYPGPVGLLRTSAGNVENDVLNFAAGIVARYSDGKDEDAVNVALSQGENDSSLETLTITPLLPEQVTPVV